MSAVNGSLLLVTEHLLDYRSTTPGLEPECEVLVGDVWCEGFVRGWYRYADGWKASVEYSTPAVTRAGTEFPSNHLSTFAADRIREANPPSS